MLSVITPTHNPTYLRELRKSLEAQKAKFEWVVVPNNGITRSRISQAIGNSKLKIEIVPLKGKSDSIGEIKRFAFNQGKGDILVELDHDDLLTPDALESIEDAFKKNPGTHFVYSDSAIFSDTGRPVVYEDTKVQADWRDCGWKFYHFDYFGRTLISHGAWPPTAAALSLVHYAPNHVRAWDRAFYGLLGGHNPAYKVCDDHELLIRTYLAGKMVRIPRTLYLYRVHGKNEWIKRNKDIQETTSRLRDEYLYRLVAREAQLSGKLLIDLGGGHGCPDGWTPVDRTFADGRVGVVADLNERWPFPDNSVGAFRAHDFLEHLPDKMHTMSEIHRCLAPGGYLLSSTPSTDGRGAFQDPTHVSYWNENAFWYWTRREQAKYIGNDTVRFMPLRLFSHFPNKYCRDNHIPYVCADLVALKGDVRPPGRISI